MELSPKNNGRSWTEYFRIITPFMLIVLSFIGGTINKNLDRLDNKIDMLDSKVFQHLTNEEMHTLKSSVVSKQEFNLYLNFADKMYKEICDIRTELSRSRK